MKQEYLNRRHALLNKIKSSSAIIIFASPKVIRKNDIEYPYCQNSDFWYFTGFNEPEAALMLIKYNENHRYSVFFSKIKDKHSEFWIGDYLCKKSILKKLNVDRAISYNNIDKHLYYLLKNLSVIYHAYGEYIYADKIVFDTLDKLRRDKSKINIFPNTIIDWRPIIREMRLFKSSNELKLMRRAGEISSLAHIRAMKKCHPGMFEYHLESEIKYEFNRHGARSSYNAIVGSGKNSCILHYTENKNKLNNGDLVLVDAGCEYNGYASDITRTFPINGKFSSTQLEIYNIVFVALETAIKLLGPGISIEEINKEVVHIMISSLVELGFIKGDIKYLIAKNAQLAFFMHNLSHWLGLDVHDVSFSKNDYSRKLEPGMVLSVEPGLYITPGIDNIPEKYHGIGIRIEDNILITKTGNENLTTMVAKKANDIEEIMIKHDKD